jgi:hypothetical protein
MEASEIQQKRCAAMFSSSRELLDQFPSLWCVQEVRCDSLDCMSQSCVQTVTTRRESQLWDLSRILALAKNTPARRPAKVIIFVSSCCSRMPAHIHLR